MSTEKYGFVYLWFDRKHKRYYIGSHWGTEDDGYICSSPWMKQAYKHRPHDFKRRILKSHLDTRTTTYLEEDKWLKLMKPEEMKPKNEKPKYYNIKRGVDNHWHQYDDQVKTIGEKISKAKMGKSNGPRSEETKRKISEATKGKKRSEEYIQKLSERMKGRTSPNKGKKMSEEQKQHLREINTGKKLSDEARRKISEANRDRIVSEETRKKISESNKGCIGRTGQTLSEEHKRKISESRSNGKHHNIGKKWYTNGIVRVLSIDCPDGFVPGKVINKQ